MTDDGDIIWKNQRGWKSVNSLKKKEATFQLPNGIIMFRDSP